MITYQQRDETSYLRPFPSRVSLLDGFKTHLQRRFAEGCTTATVLFGEIRAMGYRGAYGITKRFVAGLRQNQPAESNPRAALPTPRTLTWDILKNTARGGQLMALYEQHPEFYTDLSLLVEGWRIIRERAVQQFPNWMFRLRQSPNSILKNLALSFYKDRKVIENALLLPYSTSPVEGNINKLKLLKRQMYGRGKLDLLAAKFIRAV